MSQVGNINFVKNIFYALNDGDKTKNVESFWIICENYIIIVLISL